MHDFERTIISQYANSETLVQLITSFNGYLDPAPNFDAFYRLIWNVDTAQGHGLDVWGRIVGVERQLTIPTPIDYFGFEGGVAISPLVAVSPLVDGWAPTGTYTRTHTPTGATQTYWGPGGVLMEAPANTPCLAYDPVTGERLGWMLQAAGGNAVRNSRCEGAGPGVPPTNWGVVVNNTTGVTATVLGVVVERGMRILEIQVAGTATTAGNLGIYPETTTGIVAASGQTWAPAFLLQSVGLAGFGGAQIVIDEFTSAGVHVVGQAYAVPSPGSVLSQVYAARTLSGGAAVARMRPSLRLTIAAGATVSGILRVSLPTAGQGQYPDMPLLPPVGAPQATTRGGDTYVAPLPAARASGVIYAERRFDSVSSTVSEASTTRMRTPGAGVGYAAIRMIGGVNPYTNGYVWSGSTALADTASNSLVLGAIRRDVMAFDATSCRTWVDGAPVDIKPLSGPAPAVTELYLSSAGAITYIRDVRVYASLTDAQCLLLSGSGTPPTVPGLNTSYTPFNEGPFWGGPPVTENYTLSDEAYRSLILIKAAANIARAVTPVMNRLLTQLFGGRGRCYVNNLGHMAMRYTFEFYLEPFELAVLTQSGALPRPTGVGVYVLNTPEAAFGFAEAGDTEGFNQGTFLSIGALINAS